MTWVTLRLHRNQGLFAAAALVAVAAFLVPTGISLSNTYHQAVSTCSSTGSCGSLSDELFQGDAWMFGLVTLLTMIVPALFGVFWGSPLFAKDLEDGTHTLAWTQTATRRSWFGANAAWALVGAAIWGGVMSWLVTWWLGPVNAVDLNRFDPSRFDVQGIVPVAYALFAVSLGMVAGAWLRRVLPAVAVTVGGYIAVRAIIEIVLRPHYMAPLTWKLSPKAGGHAGGPPGGAWILSNHLVNAAGHSIAGPVSPSSLPAACQTAAQLRITPGCLAAQGWHIVVTFQPASRFWAFQGIEAAIFVALAVALAGLAAWRILRMDA